MYNIKQDTTTDNELLIILEVDVPKETIADGVEITQTVSYRPKYDYSAEYSTVDCKTIVGSTTEVEVTNKKSEFAPSTAGEDAAKLA